MMLPADQPTQREWLLKGGELGSLIRAKDWSTTPLGPRERWPQSLRTAVGIVVESKFPMALLWGPELLLLYNDGYRMIAADKHPAALGRSTREIWAEVWHINEPIFAAVMERGETLYFEDKLFPINRRGYLEEACFTLCYSPVRLEDGTVGGTLVTLEETTARRRSEQALAVAQRVGNVGSSTGAPVEIEFQIVTPDGSTRTLMSKGELVRVDPDGSPRVVVGVEQDITERKAAEEDRKRALEEARQAQERSSSDLVAMTRLRELGTLFVHERDLQPVFQKIVDTAIEICGADFGSIQLLDADTGELKIVAQRGFAGRWLEFWDQVSRGHGTCGTALERGERVIVEDVEASPIFVGTPALEVQREAGVRAVQSTPLVSRSGRPLGMFSTHYRKSTRPDDRTLHLLDLLARQAADILERQETDEALRASEERFRTVVENSRDGINLLDLRTGRYVLMSPSQVALTGFTPEEIRHISAEEAYERVHPDDRRISIEQQKMVTAGQDPGQAPVEYRWRVKSGEYRWFSDHRSLVRDAQGKPVALLGISRDITESKRAAEALRKMQGILEEGQRIAHLGSFEYLVDTKTTVWSEEEYRIHGLDPAGPSPSYEELLAKCIHPDDAARVHGAFSEALQSLTVFEVENRVVWPDGSLRWVRNRALPYFDETGKLVRYVGATLDITEARQAEEALREAARREAEAEALREADRRKNEFLAMLGHELRNPLAPIRNSLHILDRAPKGGEQARRALAVIERQFKHLTRLVDDLLDITRITRGKAVLQRERFDLRDLVGHTVEDLRGAFVEAQVGLEVLTGPGEVWVNGDRTRLSQAVGNLLANAVKFTPTGGKTTVTVQADADHGDAIIRVQDTGRGIAPEILPRLFEIFTQADLTLDRKLGGLGLGLSLVKGLVEMHGGSVRAASAGPGKGATFTIRLPLETAAPVETGRSAAEVRGPSRRVLVIEDNVDTANSLREVLTMEGHEVEVALTGPEGLAKARAFRPDVVLCDIDLPEMDGYEVARAIRANPELAHVRLIALTGYAGAGNVAKAKEAGFDDHLAKPPSLEALEQELSIS